jgi:hypothetical protein
MAVATKENLARNTESEWQTRLVEGLGLHAARTDMQAMTASK